MPFCWKDVIKLLVIEFYEVTIGCLASFDFDVVFVFEVL